MNDAAARAAEQIARYESWDADADISDIAAIIREETAAAVAELVAALEDERKRALRIRGLIEKIMLLNESPEPTDDELYQEAKLSSAIIISTRTSERRIDAVLAKHR